VNWEEQLKVYFSEFMNGYDEENQLDNEWIERLPLCLRIQNAITLIALYKMNIPGSKYHSFYELVDGVYKNGHRLFEYDFRKEYSHSKAASRSDRVVGKI
jgi:hypothetical protein